LAVGIGDLQVEQPVAAQGLRARWGRRHEPLHLGLRDRRALILQHRWIDDLSRRRQCRDWSQAAGENARQKARTRRRTTIRKGAPPKDIKSIMNPAEYCVR